MRLIKSFLGIVLIAAFFVTACFRVFLYYVPIKEEHLQAARLVTLGNFLILAAVLTALDMIRKHFFVDRPLKEIQKGIKEIIAGNFDTRIDPVFGEKSPNEYDQIISGLNHMAKELGSVETLRTDFISMVSHELKTPLTVIQNYSTLLQMPGLSEEEGMEYAAAITVQTKKMSNLISNILKLSKLENQHLYPETVTYDLGEQLCEVMLSFEDAWEKKQIQIKTSIADNVKINADRDWMDVVWTNLISNAIKYTEPQGTVCLELRTKENKAVVVVSDTGCGMSPEVKKNIFQKFYQGDTSHASEGNGLGLSLVNSIMNVTGGTIQVESKEGKGSRFTVILNCWINNSLTTH